MLRTERKMKIFIGFFRKWCKRSHESSGAIFESKEISPPWILYSGYPPGDPFWRQGGEIWFHYVWKPYYDSLDGKEQNDYLERWSVPDAWAKFYFDPEFQKWLDSVDDE